MIITRTPLRISLGGGGTDLPAYYRAHGGGFLVAAAITKYVYIAVNRNFDDDLLLKYSQVERVAKPDDVQPPAPARGAASTGHRRRRRDLLDGRHPGRAPGSGRRARSRSACSKALHAHQRRLVTNEELAELACHIEIDRLRRAGRQAGPVHRRRSAA